MTAAWASPAWTAATAYLVGAFVTKVTPDGTSWRCTTAGTSGNTEPTWPTAAPWTVTDGTVVWSLGTSFRQNVNSGIQTVLTSFMAANPTMLRAVYTERPQSFSLGELPCAFIDSQPESIAYTAGVRTRTMTAVVGLVDKSPAPEEMSDRQNFLVDALLDHFTANYHAASGNSILQVTGITESDLSDGSTHFTEVTFSLGESIVIEGRT